MFGVESRAPGGRGGGGSSGQRKCPPVVSGAGAESSAARVHVPRSAGRLKEKAARRVGIEPPLGGVRGHWERERRRVSAGATVCARVEFSCRPSVLEMQNFITTLPACR